MKKDYRPVSNSDSALSEAEFIERYWTRVWNNDKFSVSFTEEIEKREEFKVIGPYLSGLSSNGRILDGGCGLGEWTLYLASKGIDVVGLDISRATIRKLTEKFQRECFVVGDIRSTEFENNHFDAYFSWGAFEHFEDGLGAPLREARRILKTGGYLFVSVPFQNCRHLLRDSRELWLWDENYDKDRGYQSEIRFYQWRLTKAELKREFEINGFRTLEIKAIGKEQGIRGAVKYDLHIEPDSRFGAIVQRLLRLLIPRDFVAHMIIGAAQKV